MSNNEHSKQSVDSGQQSTLTSDLQQLSSKQVQRRKLLKASAIGAPIVLTLRSGAALAATSLTCDVKLANEPAPPTIVPEGTVEEVSWVRAMGIKHTFTPTMGPSEMIFEVNGMFYDLNMGQLVSAANPNQLMEWQDLVNMGGGTLENENVSVLVYFDDMHQMSVESSPGSSPLTDSCWVSIQPTP